MMRPDYLTSSSREPLAPTPEAIISAVSAAFDVPIGELMGSDDARRYHCAVSLLARWFTGLSYSDIGRALGLHVSRVPRISYALRLFVRDLEFRAGVDRAIVFLRGQK